MRLLIPSVIVAVASAVGAAALSQDVGQLRPGPGSGVVPVTGTVQAQVTNTVNAQVTNTPSVNAAQLGSWTVAVTNVPTVKVTGPMFLRAGQAYAFTWPGGQRDQVIVRETGGDGWIRVERAGQEVWVNPALVQMIERAPSR